MLGNTCVLDQCHCLLHTKTRTHKEIKWNLICLSNLTGNGAADGIDSLRFPSVETNKMAVNAFRLRTLSVSLIFKYNY